MEWPFRLLVLASVIVTGCLEAPPPAVDPESDASAVDNDAGPDAGPGTLLDGLIAWYPMETLSADDLVDEAGDHDGACVTCPGITSDAAVGDGALDFSGGGEYFLVDADTALEFVTPAGTIALWFSVADVERRTFASWPRSTIQNVWMLWSAGDAARFQAGDAVLAAGVGGVDQWVHVAGTWSGDGMATLYVNGDERAQSAYTMDFAEAKDILIGAEDDGGLGYYHDGLLDDLRIYDRALSGPQIAELVALRND